MLLGWRFLKEERTGELERISAELALSQCPSGLNRHRDNGVRNKEKREEIRKNGGIFTQNLNWLFVLFIGMDFVSLSGDQIYFFPLAVWC